MKRAARFESVSLSKKLFEDSVDLDVRMITHRDCLIHEGILNRVQNCLPMEHDRHAEPPQREIMLENLKYAINHRVVAPKPPWFEMWLAIDAKVNGG